MRYDGLIASKIRMLFQEEQKTSPVELFYKDEPDHIPENFPELHDYKITLVYRDGTPGILSVTAPSSVDAIQTALRTVKHEVRLVNCKRAFA